MCSPFHVNLQFAHRLLDALSVWLAANNLLKLLGCKALVFQ